MIGYREDVLQPAPAQLLLKMINSFYISQMIAVAAKLGVADLLAAGPKSANELADATGTHPPSLYRVLRGLASLGIFAEDAQGRFELTALAEPLRSGVSDSVRAWAVFAADSQQWQPWGHLLYSVTTGEDAFEHVFGTGNWEYRAQHPEASALFQEAMTSNSRRHIAEILPAYDFSDIHTIVDVGGGQGALIAAILREHPGMRGMLFDSPHVVEGAGPVLESAGVAGRCKTVGGDFFESVPPGGDAYILKVVIHDWDDARAAAILRNCHRVIVEGARLLLVERVVQPGNGPDSAKLRDLNMLVQNRGGRERTASEFRELLAKAGFAMTRVHPTEGELSIIEAVRASS